MTKITPEQVRSTILDVLSSIAPELDPATLHPDEPLREQIDLDSFDFLNVLIALHQRLGVEVPEKDYADVQTLNGMVHYFGHRCCEEGQGMAPVLMPEEIPSNAAGSCRRQRCGVRACNDC